MLDPRDTLPWEVGELAREQRKLAAILAADVVGYSRLMGRDESGTHARLKAHRTERLEPTLARHGGRLVKLIGDGALAEFPSAVDALGAAIEFQQAMAEANRGQPNESQIVFRIGLHLGDLIVDGDDLYGDGVNIAARLEGEAPAGGIVISGDLHNAVAGRLKATFDDLGRLALKNIDRPMQAFGVKWEEADWKVSEVSAPAASPRNSRPRASDLVIQRSKISAGDGAVSPGGHANLSAQRDVRIIASDLKAGDGGAGGPGGDLNIKAGDGVSSSRILLREAARIAYSAIQNLRIGRFIRSHCPEGNEQLVEYFINGILIFPSDLEGLHSIAITPMAIDSSSRKGLRIIEGTSNLRASENKTPVVSEVTISQESLDRYIAFLKQIEVPDNWR